MKSDQTYPDVLPGIHPDWLVRNDFAVQRIAQAVWQDSDFGRLPVLADALEEAGCTDSVMLLHLRSNHVKPYCSGCWQGTCWLVNHLLGRSQKVVARFKWRGSDQEDEATVINPGAEYGATWLLFFADCFQPPLYVIESETEENVLDVFIDSEFGASYRIDPEVDIDNDDYGFLLEAGDFAAGKSIRADGWYDLRGNFLGEGREFARTEPSYTDGGTMYDAELAHIEGTHVSYLLLGDRMPFPVTYHGPGLPRDGISPLRYFRRTACRHCKKVFFPDVPLSRWGQEEFCSRKCMIDHGWGDEEDQYPPGEIAAHIG